MSVTPVVRPRRVQEHGRIRFGVKGGKYPKAIDTFRFTSPDKQAIEQIAELYGGTVHQWSDRSARVQNQWEVITESNSIEVWVPPDSVSTALELWSAAGCQRRCDESSCMVMDAEEPVPCICVAKGVRECSPKTRFNVVLPDIDFGGVWRGESGSWDARDEMIAMMDLIDTVRDMGQPFLVCRLILKDMKKTKKGETHRWKYPQLIPQDSLRSIVQGATQFTALVQGNDGVVRPQLITPDNHEPLAIGHAAEVVAQDEEVIDAEVIDDAPVVFERVADAVRAGYSRDQLVKGDDKKWRLKEEA